MNKKLLALAVAAVAMPVIAQADGPTLYGKMNVTLDQIDNNTGTPATSSKAWFLDSNASRIGIKGDAETDVAGLKGIYQAEYEINVDGATGSTAATVFKQRNIFAGLKGGFGTVKAGMFDTPLKESQGKVDEFNDLAADLKNVMPGDTRASNIIQYSSPKLGDLVTVNVAVMPAENTNVDGATGNETGLADSISASAVLESGAFYAALAMDKNMTSASAVDTFTSGRADITRLVGAYKADNVEVGAIYQQADEVGTGATSSDTSMLLSGAYMTGAWKFKAQVGNGEGDVNNVKKTLGALGVDYKLGKSTTLFTYYATVKTDKPSPTADAEVKTLALGLEQKF